MTSASKIKLGPVSIAVIAALMTASSGSLLSASAATTTYTPNVAQDEESKKEAALRRYMKMGDDAMAAGDAATAVRHYRRAIGSSGKAVAPRNGLATALNSVGEYGEALRVLDRTEMENNGEGYYQRGKAELALGKYTEASDSFDAAAGLLAFDADAQVGRGLALAANGDPVGGLTAFDAALNSDPDSIPAISNKALLTALIGQGDVAVDMLETLVREGRAAPRDRQNLALAYMAAGRSDDAWAMALVDLDEGTAQDTFAFYQQLLGLSPEKRMEAMMTGVISQEQDTDEAANLALGDDDNKQAAAQRLAGVVVEPEEEGDIDLPPLLDPSEGYALQIAAYRTKEQLLRGIDILYGENADILEGLEPRRSEVDFGDRSTYPYGFFYRLNAGPLKTLEEAEDKCDQLKARGTACWVRPPEPSEGTLPD